MDRLGLSRTVGYGRLRALVDHGLLARSRLVHGQPTFSTATREGIAWARIPQVAPVRVSTTRRSAVGARLPVVLERRRVEAWGAGAQRGSPSHKSPSWALPIA
jgi:hypothetical protein